MWCNNSSWPHQNKRCIRYVIVKNVWGPKLLQFLQNHKCFPWISKCFGTCEHYFDVNMKVFWRILTWWPNREYSHGDLTVEVLSLESFYSMHHLLLSYSPVHCHLHWWSVNMVMENHKALWLIYCYGYMVDMKP